MKIIGNAIYVVMRSKRNVDLRKLKITTTTDINFSNIAVKIST